ncbi:hypothetical protein C5Z26_04785 [Lactobacillus sp. CBA3606]|uniref:hypothetical protein n=1 Tax=Lactobacillus sp. CBA3606 TaxID=2099789 RepID=UPI000CFE2DCC|nr:hypothetical protein [Lactobacillus sp. CBA3606]AVK63459.1 hypothetical protein C5Z26_04785 [Lactobacillus sp. CBA3606]
MFKRVGSAVLALTAIMGLGTLLVTGFEGQNFGSRTMDQAVAVAANKPAPVCTTAQRLDNQQILKQTTAINQKADTSVDTANNQASVILRENS